MTSRFQKKISNTKALLQPLRWRCVQCVIHHERDVREEKHHIYAARTSNNRVIAAHDLYCCLLPQCEALRICRSGFSDRNSGCFMFARRYTMLYNDVFIDSLAQSFGDLCPKPPQNPLQLLSRSLEGYCHRMLCRESLEFVVDGISLNALSLKTLAKTVYWERAKM